MASARRKKIVRVTAGIVAAGLVYFALQGWSIHRFGFSDDGRRADCAIVLGAAAWHNKPSPVFKERINHAITLYKNNRVPHIILTGGFGDGAPFAESEVALKYCLDNGIPQSAISIETNSQTTLQNIEEASKLLDARSASTALVVSDPWHLKRATAMAHKLGIDAHPSATPSTRFESPKARLHFLLRELYFYHVFLVFGK